VFAGGAEEYDDGAVARRVVGEGFHYHVSGAGPGGGDVWRFAIDGEHSPSPLPLLAAKAPLQMGALSIGNDFLAPKVALEMGSASISMLSKAKNGSTSYS
jgi:hypothetical protein